MRKKASGNFNVSSIFCDSEVKDRLAELKYTQREKLQRADVRSWTRPVPGPQSRFPRGYGGQS